MLASTGTNLYLSLIRMCHRSNEQEQQQQQKCCTKSKSWQANNGHRRLITERFCLRMFVFVVCWTNGIEWNGMSVGVLCLNPKMSFNPNNDRYYCDDLNQKMATAAHINAESSLSKYSTKREKNIHSEEKKPKDEWWRFRNKNTTSMVSAHTERQRKEKWIAVSL